MRTDNVSNEIPEATELVVLDNEVVATELYGKSLTPKEQQQKAWDEGTVSVFDLEAHEKLAEMDGETMPWHNDKFDAMLPDGFTKEGIKKIGGN